MSRSDRSELEIHVTFDGRSDKVTFGLSGTRQEIEKVKGQLGMAAIPQIASSEDGRRLVSKPASQHRLQSEKTPWIDSLSIHELFCLFLLIAGSFLYLMWIGFTGLNAVTSNFLAKFLLWVVSFTFFLLYVVVCYRCMEFFINDEQW